MNTRNTLLKKEEEVIFSLRELYEGYGFGQYKMSKFEEYDLYVRNKSFLISDSVITFTDTNGKLMALKPDVTLSIVKNSRPTSGSVQKVYYRENVYRISPKTHSFREILQMGLECLGDVDDYCIAEVLSLAERSLSTVCKRYVLDVSHPGLFSMLLDRIEFPEDARAALSDAVSHKSLHDAKELCRTHGVSDEGFDALRALISVPGNVESALSALFSIFCDAEWTHAVEQFAGILKTLPTDHIRIDFSVVGDLRYYSGIVFRGFVEGIPESILSGGQYDKLMERMGKKSHAVGFAVYLDQLEGLYTPPSDYDVDILVLYDKNTALASVRNTVEKLRGESLRVVAQKEIPEKLTYREIVDLRQEGGAQQ